MSTAPRHPARWLATLAALSVIATGCTPGQPSSPPASTAVISPSGPVTWTGTPDEKSPTWSANLDPDSVYGLHRRAGLPTVVRPEVVPMAAAETSALDRSARRFNGISYSAPLAGAILYTEAAGTAAEAVRHPRRVAREQAL